MSSPSVHSAASCLVSSTFDADAIQEAARGCRERLSVSPDLVLCFTSSDYRAALPELVEILQIDGHAKRIAGASARGLIGVGTEHEDGCGISMLFLSLPGVSIAREARTRNPGRAPNEAPPAGMVLLGNPLETDLSGILSEWNSLFPCRPVVGGLATGGPDPEDVFLFTEKGISDSPQLCLTFSGNLEIKPLVAQSCRPIGDPLVVTGTDKNQILSIGRREAFAVLEETFESLPDALQAQADGSIFAGLAIDEGVDEFEAGNFLIRHIVGADLERGRLTIADAPRVGQTLQFQLRDRESAVASLQRECDALADSERKPFASLLFSGQGRGRKLHQSENGDISLVEEALGTNPLAGMFTHGEAGPVAGRSFRHDHSLCGALFYEREGSAES